MITLGNYLIQQAGRTEAHLIQAAKQDENLLELYQNKLMSILEDIKLGRISAPSDALFGYWYYFSPEGPWGVWEKHPKLVLEISALINLLNLNGDDEFLAYCRRSGVDVE